MKTSLIIITRNRSKLLKRCLKSIASQTELPDEVVIVDNDSKDETKGVVENFSKTLPTKYVLEKRIGFKFARNHGARVAKHEIIAFTDDDCVANKNWVKEIKKSFANKNPGIVAGETLSLECKKPTRVQRFLDKKNNYTIKNQFSIMKRGCMASIAVQKRVFEEIGYFDENTVSCEDTDFCWRAQEAGFEVCLNENAVVRHENQKTILGFLKQTFRYGVWVAALAKKHKRFDPNYFKQNSFQNAAENILLGSATTAKYAVLLNPTGFLFGIEKVVFNLGILVGKTKYSLF